jgi:hypothetical protein
MTGDWSQNKADMVARLLGAFVVPVFGDEKILAIALGDTPELAQARAEQIIRAASSLSKG